jgi:hypothetical protein
MGGGAQQHRLPAIAIQPIVQIASGAGQMFHQRWQRAI